MSINSENIPCCCQTATTGEDESLVVKMKRSAYFMLLARPCLQAVSLSTQVAKRPRLNHQVKGVCRCQMSQSGATCSPAGERVWHEGQYDLVPSCVAESYIRHDQKGDRTVARDAYAAEIAKIHEARPGIRVVVYDHTFAGDRAWFRFAFKWRDAKTGEPQTQAGMQLYRIADGKLAETWLTMSPLGSTWPDAVAQEHWTSPSPIK